MDIVLGSKFDSRLVYTIFVAIILEVIFKILLGRLMGISIITSLVTA